MEKKDAILLSMKSNEESRRDFLKKAGKMALYTPPAIMLLMHPSRNALACSVRPSKYNGQFGMDSRYKVSRHKGRRHKEGKW
jgi:hypothetical protein